MSGRYDIEVEGPAPDAVGGKAGQPANATAVTWYLNAKVAARDERAGAYELRSSRSGWDLEMTMGTYRRLTEIKATFGSLKTELGLRPVRHRKTERIRAHLFVAVLAFHAVHLLRRKRAARGLHGSWRTIRRRLAGRERATTTLRTVPGWLIENRQETRPRAEVAEIARAASVEPQLHRRRLSGGPTLPNDKSCSTKYTCEISISDFLPTTYKLSKCEFVELGLGRIHHPPQEAGPIVHCNYIH